MILKDYLNQPVVWERRIGTNAYGEPEFEKTEIKVRWEGRHRLVRDQRGEEVVSEARVFCLVEAKPGDSFTKDDRDWPVISVSEIPDFDGNVVSRECSV